MSKIRWHHIRHQKYHVKVYFINILYIFHCRITDHIQYWYIFFEFVLYQSLLGQTWPLLYHSVLLLWYSSLGYWVSAAFLFLALLHNYVIISSSLAKSSLAQHKFYWWYPYQFHKHSSSLKLTRQFLMI